MSLEASEVAVRLRLLGGSAFRAEADASAASVERIGKAGKSVNAENAAGGVTGFFGKASRAATSHGRKLDAVGRQMQTFSRNYSMLVTAPIIGTGYAAYKAATQFQSAMNLILTEALPGVKGANQEIAFMSKQLLELGPKYGFKPVDLAKSLYQIETAGYRAGKGVAVLTAAMKGARIGGDDVTRSTNALVTILQNNFKDVPRGPRGAQQAMALIDAAVGAGRMYLPDLTAAMTTGTIQQVRLAGLGLKDFLAMVAAMTRAGVPSAQVANRARLTLTKLMNPNGKMPLADLAMMGLGQYQLASDLRSPAGLLGALRDLQAHLRPLPIDQQHHILADLFGQSRGLANAAGLLQTIGVMGQIKNGVLDKTTLDTFNLHFQQAMNTSRAKQQQAGATIQSSLITLGQQVQKLVNTWLPQLTHTLVGILGALRSIPPGVLIGLAALGPMVGVLGTLGRVLGALSTALGWLAGKGALGKAAQDAAKHGGGGVLDTVGKTIGGAALAAASKTGPVFRAAVKGVSATRYLNPEMAAAALADLAIGSGGGSALVQNTPHWRSYFGAHPRYFLDDVRMHGLDPGLQAAVARQYIQSGQINRMSDGLRKALAEALHIEVKIDGRTVATAVSKSNRETANRR